MPDLEELVEAAEFEGLHWKHPLLPQLGLACPACNSDSCLVNPRAAAEAEKDAIRKKAAASMSTMVGTRDGAGPQPGSEALSDEVQPQVGGRCMLGSLCIVAWEHWGVRSCLSMLCGFSLQQ